MDKSPRRNEGDGQKVPKGSVGELLAKKAAELKESKKKKKEVERGRDRKRRSRSRNRRRKRSKSSSRDSSGSRSSGSSPSFRGPSTRGETEMWRQSKRNPGMLLKKAVKEMQRYLAARAEGGETEMGEDWTKARMLSYINQVVLVQHPPSSIGLRNHRELITLGTGIDMLLSGQLGELGDLLVQRLKARSQIGARRRVQGQEPRIRDATPNERREGKQCRKEGGDRPVTQADRPSGGESRKEAGREEAPRRRAQEGGLESKPRKMEEERKTERSRSRKITLVERKREEEPDTDEAEWDTTSVTSAGVMEGDLEALQVMREWLRSEDTGGLTVAQSGALLALTARRSGTALGKYLERMVLGSDGARNSRQRSLLPLPLKEDSKLALRELFESGEYRRLAGTWGAKKDAKTKAAKVARKTGMLIWHGLLVTTVNVLWTGGSKDAAIHSGPVTKAQEMALERFWEAIRAFVDDTSESKEKVPRSTGVGEWGAKLGDVRISYEGEVIEKAHRITLDQVLPGLPPKGYGGSVPLVELCEGELKEKLLRPESNLMAEENWPEDIPAPKVHADIEQWEKLAHELHQRGLIEAVEDPILVKGKPLRNGAFGVVKAGKFLPDERPVLRLIMDFRAINSVTTVLTGDIKTLTGAPALQHIVLPEGHVLRMSTDDLVAAFYLFQLPPGWSRMMTFSAPVSWKMLGVDRPGKVLVGARVLPMGWASAVGVLQHAHRRLALRSPLQGGGGLLGRCEIRRDTPFPDLGTENKVWSLYLDDTNLVEMMLARVGKEMQGKPSEEQQRLRQAYEHWGIPISLEKALERAQKAEKLGAVIDGDAGLVRTAMKRAIDSISLGMWLLRQDRAPRKALQVFLGKEVHSLQFRRPLFAIFDYLWKEIASGEVMLELGLKSVEEVLLAGFCQPLRFTDLKAKLNEVVTASDASETGGGMVYSSKLTTQGIRDTVTAEGGLDATPEYGLPADDEQKVVVFDFFSGIGGLSRALEHAQMGVERLVIVESDRECRRLNKNRWPGCEVICDIRSMTKKDIEKVVRSVPGVTGIIGAGGSPCQGLSKLPHSTCSSCPLGGLG
eukprot:Skav221072  [mRNA]  locus=scaffold3118:298387:301731:- [translate_table: standard]